MRDLEARLREAEDDCERAAQRSRELEARNNRGCAPEDTEPCQRALKEAFRYRDAAERFAAVHAELERRLEERRAAANLK